MAVPRTTGAGIRASSRVPIRPRVPHTSTTGPQPLPGPGTLRGAAQSWAGTRTIRGSGKARRPAGLTAFRKVTAAPPTGAPPATGSRCARCGRIPTGRRRQPGGTAAGPRGTPNPPPGPGARSGHPVRVTTRATRVPAQRPGRGGPRVLAGHPRGGAGYQGGAGGVGKPVDANRAQYAGGPRIPPGMPGRGPRMPGTGFWAYRDQHRNSRVAGRVLGQGWPRYPGTPYPEAPYPFPRWPGCEGRVRAGGLST